MTRSISPLSFFSDKQIKEKILGVSNYDPDAIAGGSCSDELIDQWGSFLGYFHSSATIAYKESISWGRETEANVDSSPYISEINEQHATLTEILEWLEEHSSENASPKSIVLTLQVVNAYTNVPVTGANVSFNVDGDSLSNITGGLTDSEGNLSVELPFYPSSSYTALVQASGYHSQEFDTGYETNTTPEQSGTSLGVLGLRPISTIAQTPMSGPPGTTFAQWGTGFTPNSTATMHFRKPDGTEYPTMQQAMDSTGHFDISYTAPTDKEPGNYTWWVVDGPTGISSNEVTYIIEGTEVNPTIAQTPMSGPPGTTFSQWGTGFTPNSTGTMHFRKSDGTEDPTMQQEMDSSGHFDISMVIVQEAGNYTWWVVDGPTGISSNQVTYTIELEFDPVIEQIPMSGPPGTTFTQWGTGFTPNSTGTMHFRKPDGTEYPTKQQDMDSIGYFFINYTAPADKEPGEYTWWVVDGPTGVLSNQVTYTIEEPEIDPTIAQTPMSGPPGTTFAQWGTGFTPNSTGTMHFRKPDGSEYPTMQQAIDSTGHFDITYTAPMDKAPGEYTWWVVDGPTGISSNQVTYTIEGTGVEPTIAQTPMSGPPGTTFAQWGTGFTPNSTGTMHFRKPDGTEYPTMQQAMDSTGHFDITYTAPTSKAPGNYTWWVIDGPTGISSNQVTYTITSP